MTSETTQYRFCVRQWDGESSYGEKIWLYQIDENNLADDMDDAYAKATFSFEDEGVACKRLGAASFRTATGDEYRIVLEVVA